MEEIEQCLHCRHHLLHNVKPPSTSLPGGCLQAGSQLKLTDQSPRLRLRPSRRRPAIRDVRPPTPLPRLQYPLRRLHRRLRRRYEPEYAHRLPLHRGLLGVHTADARRRHHHQHHQVGAVRRDHVVPGHGPLLGPIISPVTGGYLSQACGWRRIFWLLAIIGSAGSRARSSCPRRTRRLRKATGNPLLYSRAAAPRAVRPRHHPHHEAAVPVADRARAVRLDGARLRLPLPALHDVLGCLWRPLRLQHGHGRRSSGWSRRRLRAEVARRFMTEFSAPPQKAILGTSTNNAYLLGLSGIDTLDE